MEQTVGTGSATFSAAATRRFDLLVFDWDGTLMDSAAAIAGAIQAAVRDLDFPPPSDEAARHIIGLGLNEAIAHLLPELERSEYGRLAERYRYHFLAEDANIPLFPGAYDAITELRGAGFLLAVATGKSRKGLQRAFRHTGLGDIFHGSRCADENHSKPHPGMLLDLMDEMGVVPQRTLMIGDTTHDLQMAINAGVPGLAAAYGAHPRESLVALSPLACLDDFAQLSRWLTRYA